jgi:hypothetical protein
MAVTTPAIPATTVAQLNTTGQTVDVALTGGTLTNVTVFNPETGTSSTVATSTPCNYSIPPGGTHTLTYSVVPVSMVWTDPLDLDDVEPQAENTGSLNEETDEPEPAHTEGGESGLGIGVDN